MAVKIGEVTSEMTADVKKTEDVHNPPEKSQRSVLTEPVFR